MFEGDLTEDLPNIPLVSGPVESDMKFLPWKLIPASSGPAKWSTMQVVHVHVLLMPHTVSSPPHPNLTSRRIILPASEDPEENILHWFWGLQMMEASKMVVAQSNARITHTSG